MRTNPTAPAGPVPQPWPPRYPLAVPKDCVLYYLMQEPAGAKVLDHSANRTDGTVIGAMPVAVPGGIGQCRYFDGIDDRITAGNPSSISFGTGSFSVELWVYVTANLTAWDTPIWKGGSGASTAGFDFELGSGTWTFNISDGSALRQARLLDDSVIGKWMHLVGVVDRQSARQCGYCNTVAQPVVDIPGFGSATTSNTLTIGAGNSGGLPFNGYIGLVRLYNRALSASEVTAAYREHAWRFGLAG